MGTDPVERLVRCPACRGDSVYAPTNPFRPFCSRRCREIDFGAWASEGYRVEAPPSDDDPDIASPPADVH